MSDDRAAMRDLLSKARAAVRSRTTAAVVPPDGSTGLIIPTDAGATLGREAALRRPTPGSSSLLNAKDNGMEFAQYYFQVIRRFVQDQTKYELEVPNLTSFDRLVVHSIAEKCFLSHSSTGMGASRLLRLKKDALFFQSQPSLDDVDVAALVKRVTDKESKYHLRRVTLSEEDKQATDGRIGSYGDEDVLKNVQRLREATNEYIFSTQLNEAPLPLQQSPNSSQPPPAPVPISTGGGDSHHPQLGSRPVAGSSPAAAAAGSNSTHTIPTPSLTNTTVDRVLASAPASHKRERATASYVEICRGCSNSRPLTVAASAWQCEKTCERCGHSTIWYLEEVQSSSTATAPSSSVARGSVTGSTASDTTGARLPGVDESTKMHDAVPAASAAPEEIQLDDDEEELTLGDAMDWVGMCDYSSEDALYIKRFAEAVLAGSDEESGAAPYPLQKQLAFCIDFQDLLHMNIFRGYRRWLMAEKKASQQQQHGDDDDEEAHHRPRVRREATSQNEEEEEGLYVVVREHKEANLKLSELLDRVGRAAFSPPTVSVIEYAPHIAIALPNTSVYGVEATAICQVRPLPLHGPASEVRSIQRDQLKALGVELGLHHIGLWESLEEAIAAAQLPTV